MKRLVLLLAAVLLAGCTLSAPASSVPACSGTASDPVQPSETLIYFGLPVEGYNIACQVSENGYFDFFADYEKNIGFLTRYDFADMTQHILCDKDGCLHADKTCDAYAPCWQVIALSDAVYTVDYNYAEDGETFTGTQTLVHRDADGMHPRPVSVIGDWAFFGADEKYLYGFCDGSFGRVDRTTGTETLLLHDAQQLYRTAGPFWASGTNSSSLPCWTLTPHRPSGWTFFPPRAYKPRSHGWTSAATGRNNSPAPTPRVWKRPSGI